MGQKDLRRLLFTGAMAVVWHASRQDAITDPWLAGMLARKPKKVVAVALANRTAQRVWAVGHEAGDLPGSRRRLSEKRDNQEEREAARKCGQQAQERGKGTQSVKTGSEKPVVGGGPTSSFSRFGSDLTSTIRAPARANKSRIRGRTYDST